MNTWYGVQIRKVINEFYYIKSEHWMHTNYDDNVLECWRYPKVIEILKLKEDGGLDGVKFVKTKLPKASRRFFIK